MFSRLHHSIIKFLFFIDKYTYLQKNIEFNIKVETINNSFQSEPVKIN